MSNAFVLKGDIDINYNDCVNGLEEVDKKLDDTADGMKDAESSSGSFGDSLKSKLSGGISKVGDSLGKVATRLTAFVGATVALTNEMGMGLAKLETNADKNGITMDTVNQGISEFIGLGADTDQSYEAMSNLLMAGVGEENVVDVVNALNGAVISFPDTLSIESMADSLQEMAGSGQVTGQLAELFDRLGISTEDLQTELDGCSTKSDRLNVVLGLLNESGMTGINKAFQENNKGLVDNNKATYNFKESMSKLGETLTPVVTKFTDFITKIVNGFNNLSPKTQNAIVTIGSIITVIGLVGGALSGLSGALTFLTSPVGLIILAIGLLIGAGVLLWQNLDTVKQKCGEVVDWMKEKWQGFTDWIGGVFTTDWTSKFGIVGEVINAICANIRNYVDAIKRVFGGIIDFVKGVFTGDWSKAWEGVKNIFGGIWDSFESMVKAPLNGVIALVNMAIGGINKIKVDVPDWIPGIGGKEFGFNIPKIKYLYTGGIFNEPTLLGNTVVGDNFMGKGKQSEVVAPISDLREMIKDILQIELNINIDGKDFVRKVVAPHQRELTNYGYGR